MKQLLFLLLFPCLALAQYPGNAGQKISLGEQTTADGLVYRGLAADTTRKPSVDTMAYILLDTNTNIIWQYKKATNNAWTRVGGSISSGVTGVLPVANGGTGSGTQNFVDLTTTQTVGGSKTFSSTINSSAVNSSVISATTATETFKRIVLSSTGGNLTLGIQNNLGNPSFLTNPYASIIFTRAKTDLVFGTNDIQRAIIKDTTGNFGLGVTAPTAKLHLSAGTVNPNTAPIKFTAGNLLTTPEALVLETNNNFLFFTNNSPQRFIINHGIRQDASINFDATAASSSSDKTITVTNAEISDVVSLGIPNSTILPNVFYMAWVSAANTVTVRLVNFSDVSVDPDAATFKVFVTK